MSTFNSGIWRRVIASLPSVRSSQRAVDPAASGAVPRAASSTFSQAPGGTGWWSSVLPMARWQLAKRGWPPCIANSIRWPCAHSQPSCAWSRAISADRVSGCLGVAA
ncbi:hypothetical protein D3C81_1985770 [compost metagenome]